MSSLLGDLSLINDNFWSLINDKKRMCRQTITRVITSINDNDDGSVCEYEILFFIN